MAAPPRRIALIGNPNSGKTTLFNRLTGQRRKVANYAGVTVDRSEGTLRGRNGVRLFDLPGCYSLTPRSLDQRIARDTLLGWNRDEVRPDALVVIIDASNLERNLFLATQLLELGLPTVVVCNMADVLRKRGDRLDTAELSARLGAPVVATVASSGEGIDELCSVLDALPSAAVCHSSPLGVPEELNDALADIRELVMEQGLANASNATLAAKLLLSPSVLVKDDASHVELSDDDAERLRAIHRRHHIDADNSPLTVLAERRYAWIGQWLDGAFTRAEVHVPGASERIDGLLTHRVWGVAAFAGVMFLMLTAIFSWATPLMDGIDWLINQKLAGIVATVIGQGILSDLLVDGVIAGVGNVVVFFPQICILFLFISLLEDSGYMARVAYVMDGLMSRVGLHGKSFIPMLSSFACAVPAIMATRTIEDRRDRLTTILVAPLMSCSARLPVYIIIISAVFGANPWLKVGIMMAMYLLGTVTALLVALVLKRTILKGPTPTFILELPPYRLPRLGPSIQSMWSRSRVFLTEAGTIILAMSVVLWALAYFPRASAADIEAGSGVQLRQSYMGRIGRVIEPVIEPLGFDWKIGVGLASSFAAREVFIATMGVVYGVGDEVDEKSATLREEVASAKWPDGRKVFTPLVGVSLMVFYVLACQCMSTIAVVRKETGNWGWPVFMFTYMTVLAYVASLVVYQGGRLLGLA